MHPIHVAFPNYRSLPSKNLMRVHCSKNNSFHFLSRSGKLFYGGAISTKTHLEAAMGYRNILRGMFPVASTEIRCCRERQLFTRTSVCGMLCREFTFIRKKTPSSYSNLLYRMLWNVLWKTVFITMYLLC
ncbi:hypothetical protein CEXT_85571 [Caerostris extrusa]|uniref:Uncharacterized protein n=1 Tax=Caerostris extrusa TaxID=172846 RepID=A0AAV4WK34_CAEEX|nr:hypothetical protein CEXT_85571 [Caerostris extrusa]